MPPAARVLDATLPKTPASPADIAKMHRAAKATGLPENCESPWFNRPTLKVSGQWLICARQAGVYVMFCPKIEKEILIERAPEIYFDTDHHRNFAAILAWAKKVSVSELSDRIARAWRLQAPKKLQREFDKPSTVMGHARAKSRRSKKPRPASA